MSKVLPMKVKPEPPTEERLRAEAEAFLEARGFTIETVEPLHDQVYRELVRMWDEAKPGGKPPGVLDLVRRVGTSQASVSGALRRLRDANRVVAIGSKLRPVWVPVEAKEK